MSFDRKTNKPRRNDFGPVGKPRNTARPWASGPELKGLPNRKNTGSGAEGAVSPKEKPESGEKTANYKVY